MAVLVVALAMFVMFPTEGMQEFMRHSNGVYEFELVTSEPCETGLRGSGYALVPFRSVTLKQKNLDGTVSEKVCAD